MLAEKLRPILFFCAKARLSKKLLFASILLGGSDLLVGLVKPYLAGLLVDDALLSGNAQAFLKLSLIGAAVFAVSEILAVLESRIRESLRLRATFNLNLLVFRNLQEKSLGWFRKKAAGEHIFSLVHDSNHAAEFASSAPKDVFYLAGRLVLTLAAAAWISRKLALAGAVLSVLVYVSYRLYGGKIEERVKRRDLSERSLLGFIEETFSRVLVLKLFGAERRRAREFAGKQAALARAEWRVSLADTAGRFSSGFLAKAAVGFVSLYGMYLVMKGEITAGNLTAALIYLGQFVSAQEEVAGRLSSLADITSSCRRLEEVFSEPAFPRLGFPDGDGFVSLKSVSLGYDEKPVLKNLDMEIPAGAHAAIAGASGCGKTTAALLILGFYRPAAGKISVGGRALAALQEPLLLNDTVLNNVRFGNPKAAPEEIRSACQTAGAHGFITELSQGYETQVGENAASLSQGQKQRLAVARAVLARPKILILDEALSSVEPALEREITQNIRKNYPGMTLITISHRLSAVEPAEIIFRINEGRAETGISP